MTSKKNRRDEAVLLRAINLTKIFSGRAEKIVVFRDLNLEVARGEMVAITGESGAGKSTLLHLLGGLDRPTSGSVKIDEFDIAKNAELDLACFRNRRIGFVFQFHHLLPKILCDRKRDDAFIDRRRDQSDAARRANVLLIEWDWPNALTVVWASFREESDKESLWPERSSIRRRFFGG